MQFSIECPHCCASQDRGTRSVLHVVPEVPWSGADGQPLEKMPSLGSVHTVTLSSGCRLVAGAPAEGEKLWALFQPPLSRFNSWLDFPREIEPSGLVGLEPVDGECADGASGEVRTRAQHNITIQGLLLLPVSRRAMPDIEGLVRDRRCTRLETPRFLLFHAQSEFSASWLLCVKDGMAWWAVMHSQTEGDDPEVIHAGRWEISRPDLTLLFETSKPCYGEIAEDRPMSLQEVRFFHAIQNGDIENVRSILTPEAALLSSRDVHGQPPLIAAAGASSAPMIHFLLDAGADPRALSLRRQSVLHVAARRGDIGLLEFFLDRGVDVNQPDHDGNTPLHEAVFASEPEAVIHLLLNRGADRERRNEYEATPMRAAEMNRRSRAIAALKS